MQFKLLLPRLLMAALGASAAATASAQLLSPGYAYSGAPMSNFLSSSYLTQSIINNPAGGKAAVNPSPTSRRSLTVHFARPSGVPAQLANQYPAEQRPQAQAVFEQLLKRYADIEKQFKIPRGDLGGAVAAFLAGNYMGLHNADFPDRQFPPVVQQMRSALATHQGLAKASEADKQAMYDQMAILGMLMATTQVSLRQQPNPDVEKNMRETARRTLQGFLKTDPERMQFTDRGLAMR